MLSILKLPFLIIILAALPACKRNELFETLGDKFATPTDVATDSTGDYFFVLNSDDNRDYDIGSILVLTKDGDKVGVVSTPRLGRTLSVADNDMLATFSYSGEGTESRLNLYDVTDPKAVKLNRSWALGDCNPINAVLRSGYKYFAVSCANGSIFIGELATNRADSTIHRVRRYPQARRALYLDPSRNLLLAFTTELKARALYDSVMEDRTSYEESDTNTEVKTPNEIPDVWEASRSDRRNKLRRGIYQYVVYDIAAEAAKNFPQVDDYTTSAIQTELRWMYFNLSNFDGAPDVSESSLTAVQSRYYRTNFWAARANPLDANSFYLSHRGTSETSSSGSPHANSIIRVSIKGDLRPPASGTAPRTENVLSFERVYGFKGELDANGRHFPGTFDVKEIQGSPLLVVNHFRDIKNFPSSRYSSIAAKVIGENGWFSEITEGSSGHSYYQLAVTPAGRAIAISYYQNLAILLDVAPGTAITEFKTIN